jgi:signal transduction histidine kinase
MQVPLRVLSLEDDPLDADLIQETLEAAGIECQVTRIETEAELIGSLQHGGVDLILADYTLPGFDGLSALKITRQSWPDLPFIFVSGTLGEDVAIEALKIGATDYVLKTRLSRLVPSVHRALRESTERAERKRAEEALRRSEAYLATAQRLSLTGSFGWDVLNGEIFWSLETFRIFEYDPAAKVTIGMILDRTHPEDRSAVQQLIDRVSKERQDFDLEHRLRMPDGSVKYLRVVGHPSRSESGRFELVGAVTDITEHKVAEEILRRSFNIRMEERVNERTRVAQDLHDTLLQSFQGVLLKFNAATFLLQDRPGEARKVLETAIEQARKAIEEGRDAVQGLRSPTFVTDDLARAVGRLGEELGSIQAGHTSPDFRVKVKGKLRDLVPLLHDEVYRIAGEAMRNAFTHANAKHIEVEIHYEHRQFRLRVRDDGKGIDPNVLGGAGRTGHYGLRGMQERAKFGGGKLAIWSELNSGTDLELTIPASIAYAKSSKALESTTLGEGS